MTIDIAMARAFDAYQIARPEIGALHLQADETKDQLDNAAWETAIRAYELESVMRGFGLRIQAGKAPEPEWREHFNGAYRFHAKAEFPNIKRRLQKTRPHVAAYLDAVINLEGAMRDFLAVV